MKVKRRWCRGASSNILGPVRLAGSRGYSFLESINSPSSRNACEINPPRPAFRAPARRRWRNAAALSFNVAGKTAPVDGANPPDENQASLLPVSLGSFNHPEGCSCCTGVSHLSVFNSWFFQTVETDGPRLRMIKASAITLERWGARFGIRLLGDGRYLRFQRYVM